MLKVSKKPTKGVSEKERKEKFSKMGYSLKKGNKKDKLYIVKDIK